MERLGEENCGPNGTKSLSFFMNSDDTQPNTLATELFFRTNIKVIKSVYPDVEEKEAIREELKNHFDTLLYHPVGNSLHYCFIRWRDVISKCRFGFLIRIVKDAYELYLRNNFDLHCMDDWKQRDDEPVRGYNRRYRQRLIELYPDFMNKLYRMTNTRSDETNFLRTEIVGNYIASLKDELGDIMPIFKRNEKCLEIIMETAEYYEKEWTERKKRRERESKETLKHSSPSFVEFNKKKYNPVCYNCGKRGHIKRRCRQPPVKCQFCRKRGHLIQFCYGRRQNLIVNSSSDPSTKFLALIFATIVMSLIAIVQEN